MATVNQYPSEVLKDAVEAISSLPGIGVRRALDLSLYLLRQNPGNIRHISESISRLATDVRYCKTCMMVSDGDICPICSDEKRDRSTICVVESVRDVMSIEQTGQYHGVYHVLGGIISPINGVAPSDIKVAELVERLKNSVRPVEVILALSGSVEGETTAFYIFRQISGLCDKVSTLARGLGYGADMEYADSLTLGRAIVNRQEFKG